MWCDLEAVNEETREQEFLSLDTRRIYQPS